MAAVFRSIRRLDACSVWRKCCRVERSGFRGRGILSRCTTRCAICAFLKTLRELNREHRRTIDHAGSHSPALHGLRCRPPPPSRQSRSARSVADSTRSTSRLGPLDRGVFDRDATGGKFFSGVWRYQALLPNLPEDAIVSRAEGRTPIYWDDRIAAYAGLRRIGLKHEGQNPTASFKDRGMTVGVSHAKAVGAKIVACASTGNTSASLASYAAAGGHAGTGHHSRRKDCRRQAGANDRHGRAHRAGRRRLRYRARAAARS